MDFASALVAFIGITGQLLQGVKVVCDFLSDVNDAPSEIASLNIRLNLLINILQNIIACPETLHVSQEALKNVEEAMKLVYSQVSELAKLIQDHRPSKPGQRKLLWSSINVAFRKNKFEKCGMNITQALDLLLLSLAALDSHTLRRQSQTLDEVHRKVSALHDFNLTAANAPGSQITAITGKNVPFHKPEQETRRRSKDQTDHYLAQGISKDSMLVYHNVALTRSQNKVFASYCNSWFGTIRIVSRSTQEKSRDKTERALETLMEKRQAFLQLKPAAWFSWLGLDLGLHRINALYGSTRLQSTLEPVRYVKFPYTVHEALHIRDTNCIRRMLSNGEISLYDKDYHTEQSLLDYCISSLWSYSTLREDESPTELVEFSQWLVSLGLTPNYEAIHHEGQPDYHPIIDMFWQLYDNTTCADYDESHIVELRKLFIAAAESMPTILLAKAMVRFGFTFPSQASYMEPLIVDLIKDSALTEDWHSLEHGFRDPYDDEEKMGLPPVANIILLCLWRIAVAELGPPEGSYMANSIRTSILRPVRALLLKIIELVETESHWDKSQWRCTVGWVLLCKEVRMFEGGFAEFVSKYACKAHYLENWEAVQNLLPSDILKSDNSTHEKTCLYPALRVRLDFAAEQDDQQNTRRIIAKIADPHEIEATNYFLESDAVEGTKDRLYDSHNIRPSTDICFVRQEGSELHFDCGISDPEFPHEGRWEDARQYYAEFDRDLELFTREETTEPPIKEEEVTDAFPPVDLSSPTERSGLVSRLASGGLSIISSIV